MLNELIDCMFHHVFNEFDPLLSLMKFDVSMKILKQCYRSIIVVAEWFSRVVSARVSQISFAGCALCLSLVSLSSHPHADAPLGSARVAKYNGFCENIMLVGPAGAFFHSLSRAAYLN